MSIIQFLKLIKKNIILILIVPFILGTMVWYLTRHETKFYSSKTTIYTGVGSGLSMESLGASRLDFFGSKVIFSNILNIFKARETHKEVALRLLAQGLTLNSWDPQYISRRSYIKLHKQTPQYIKDLVAQNQESSLEDLIQNTPLILNDTNNLPDKQLIWANTFYNVMPGENLFSLSEKFKVQASEIMNWNKLTSTQLNEGQKLIVNRTKKVVYSIFPNGHDTINLYIPDTSYFIATSIDSLSFEKTVERFRRYSDANDTNYIYKLLNKGHPFYGMGAISKNSAKRVQGSDLVSISYKSSDPGICKQTLIFLIYAFEKNYRSLNSNQSDHIVAYFQKKVKESAALLIAAENRLLEFNQTNNIINYYEQTRHISDQKEQLDSRFSDEKMKYSAADSVINIIEKQLKNLSGISSLNNNLLRYRNDISDITYKIAINELNNPTAPKAIDALNKLVEEREAIKAQISRNLDSTFQIQYTAEGVNVNDLLSMWLTKVIEYEESKATLAALYDRKKEFQKTYEIFAPLGAKLKRIEREINVYEGQYMSHLQSLNQAMLKQQNIEFRSNTKVVDPPFFPLGAEKSARTMMIAASIIVGLVLTLFIVILLEYLDETIKYPKRAEKLTGLKLISGYPILFKKKKAINYDFISNRTIEMLIQNMRGALKRNKISEKEKPIKLLVFSTQITDGKTLIQERLAVELRRIGHKVLSLNYYKEKHKPKYSHKVENLTDYVEYPVDEHYFNQKSMKEMVHNDALLSEWYTFDYVIIELPAGIQNPFPPDIVRDADFGIMVARANRTWQKADIASLNSFKEFLKYEPEVLLNGVNPEFLQDIIGEIPRDRSRIRRIIKKIVRLQVFERYQIKKW
ncbi:MAG: hypothetical protein B7C24_00525 [Bacteroidetes bacterium 4572_77]|nr:MAG: hypothetical protein B7C24_00525 [Bacteroidetes bacterium 4572_77]